MARPKKQSLDYFPLDVGALSDAKLIAPRQEFGYLATVTYLELLCMIYRDKGYYLQYDDETRRSVLWTLTTGVLAGKYQPSPDTIAQVIARLVASGLFSGDLFDRGILTSRRIQETYYSATLDRKSITINWDYWLLGESDMRELSSRSIILSNFINRSKNPGYSIEKPGYSIESHHKEKEKKTEIISERKSEIISERKQETKADFLSAYRERFEALLNASPSRSHLAGVGNLFDAGRSGEELLAALEYAAGRAPADPEPYIYVVARDWKPPERTHPAQEEKPTGELAEWERDWLAEMNKRQEAKQNAE